MGAGEAPQRSALPASVIERYKSALLGCKAAQDEVDDGSDHHHHQGGWGRNYVRSLRSISQLAGQRAAAAVGGGNNEIIK